MWEDTLLFQSKQREPRSESLWALYLAYDRDAEIRKRETRFSIDLSKFSIGIQVWMTWRSDTLLRSFHSFSQTKNTKLVA